MMARRLMNCSEPALGRLVGSYCFDDATEAERNALQAHLLDCDTCWREVERLEAAVRVLKTDTALVRSFLRPDIVAMFGLSSGLSTRFGGHPRYAFITAVSCGVLYAIMTAAELAYDWDVYTRTILTSGASAALVMAAALVASFWTDWRLVTAGRRFGLAMSIAIVTCAGAAVAAVMMATLPSVPIVHARFQTYTAAAGFLKTSSQIMLMTFVFVLLPYHTVLVLQREIQEGRHRMTLALLTNDSSRVVPRGAVFLSPRTLMFVLATFAAVALYGVAYLFDNLVAGRHMQLFMTLVQVRVGVYFAIAVASIAWYAHALNELKRECLALGTLQHDTEHPVH